MEDTKLIFSPQLAKFLLSKGHVIIDLKAKKEDICSTIFVFKYNSKLILDIDLWKSEKK